MPDEKGYNEQNFKMTPCAVKYGDELLGGTDGAVSVSCETEYYESKCNQAGNMILAKRITQIKYTIKAKFKEINNALKAVLGEALEVNSSLIGQNIFEGGKALVLSEIGGTDVHTFPKAIALKEYSYDINGVEEHGIELTFEAIADADGVIYKVTAA